ncbi:TPA: 4-amino-4-deoxy-L-arabinose-phospho-UDP flippase [Citrobacter freundii]|uniref:4-amino-4-deoxy-L-arabinose-phospho-UDP flippase n=2 Tax=Citrobacter farmeri TaxID=67824 RepID=A0ACA8D975_9ENTR|nr:4-amino-4-deoxy-L-arabinose-phosphoundecaprenol flippase subunit ArnF [Citrobacter farmeri]HAT2166206.1 4-amino-4-deoxy-L-arabinose-phospho-UDP flippase [Citrobacter freundii]AST80736.1 4-amino-4-deoxy-L-arabinose-phospho-UDP flippase [Citrobacter farmeri]EKV7298286.1 4-amino-4-deoxy-L-arabinose-phospho-UDP flippase [Citrobacter farmeri]ELR9634451.1 4-amino-4-deoxy-L-arabinose-phospho-UDP flippase [Citrobacter farmeri]EMB4690794.1 4-amino-4-deoxy-L-arabinose-phospho-UDP flippase [Citrobacte
MGLLWGLCSVIITSVAQLGLGFAMANLPSMTQWQTFIPALFSVHTGTLALFAGLMGYLLSVFCWHNALHYLALSKAYALLSLSYVLVWVASITLPGWQGAFSLKALLGVSCIMAGLMFIFLPAQRKTG